MLSWGFDNLVLTLKQLNLVVYNSDEWFVGISFPNHFVGILFPGKDVEIKFQHDDMGISFPCFGVGTTMHWNRKSIHITDFEDQKISMAYHSEY